MVLMTLPLGPITSPILSRGISNETILGAVGAVIGFFVIPVVGLPIGALLGLLLGEYLDKGDVGVAWAATIELAKGFGLSALVQFGLGFLILLTWSAWALASVVG